MSDARIAFDLTAGQLVRGGTGVYTMELAAELQRRLGDRFVPVACPRTRPPSPRRTMRDRGHTLVRDLWWFQGGAARAAGRRGAQLLHSPIPSRGSASQPPLVITVHDLAILRFPDKFRSWMRRYWQRAMPPMISSARHIITPSRATKDEVVELLQVDPARITVVPEGVARGFTPASDAIDTDDRSLLARHRIEGPFVLTVGAIEPRKNLERLLRAVAQLRERTPHRELQLIHAGPDGWLSDALPQLVQDLQLSTSVRFLGMVPRDELAALYRVARVTVYPSLYEGFGLPVVEALASGSPVVTSDRSSLPEVGGDAALLVDPTSVESIADGIARAWTDEGLRSEMIRRGLVWARSFTWDEAARQTADVYERVLLRKSA